MGMCLCEENSFQAVLSEMGYQNQDSKTDDMLQTYWYTQQDQFWYPSWMNSYN